MSVVPRRIVSRLTRMAFSVACVAASSCVIGPKYSTPTAPTSGGYKEAAGLVTTDEWKPSEPSDYLARGAWWRLYGDPMLNDLEMQLNISNQTIAAAAANVQVARALIRQARAQYFPTVAIGPAIYNTRISSGFGRAIGVTFTEYSLPLEATWEPDLWGRVRQSVRASAYAAQSVAADLESVRLAAQADLATAYFQLRAQDELALVLDSTVTSLRATLDLTRVLFIAGRTSDEAVAQAEAQFQSTQAQLTNAGVLRAQLEHAIAVLVGKPPSALSIPVDYRRERPVIVPPSVPSNLLERRPDIASFERQVAEANARIGVAQTAYFPTLTLGGSAGFLGLSLSRLLSWPNRVWSVGPSLLQTIFDGGLRRATVEQYRATYEQTVANYRQTVLTAFQQVEDNLAALRILTQVIEQQDIAIAAARRGLGEANVRYSAGIDPYLNVLAAQIIQLNQQQTQVAYRLQRMIASVQLIKALGGGWDVSLLPTPDQLRHRAPLPSPSR